MLLDYHPRHFQGCQVYKMSSRTFRQLNDTLSQSRKLKGLGCSSVIDCSLACRRPHFQSPVSINQSIKIIKSLHESQHPKSWVWRHFETGDLYPTWAQDLACGKQTLHHWATISSLLSLRKIFWDWVLSSPGSPGRAWTDDHLLSASWVAGMVHIHQQRMA